MRFFKYFIFLIFFITANAKADWKTTTYAEPGKIWQKDIIYFNVEDVCNAFKLQFGTKVSKCEANSTITRINAWVSGTPVHIADFVASSCPPAGTEMYLDGYITSPTGSAPDGIICSNGCEWNHSNGSATATDTPNGNLNWGFDVESTGKSCSQETPKGEDAINNEMVCTTDYCVKPADKICPVGYSKQMFNNVDYCVKDGKNPPDNPDSENPDPDNPNNCTQSYCPKPDDTKDCPAGYYPTVYNGEKICVKDNPTPNQPNPNDPNNNDNPPSSEPVAGDDPNTSFDTKGIIDSIKALRDSLLGAIDSVSKKISSLVDGQKTSNEHLKNIEQGVSASSEVLSDMKNYFTDETGSDISAVDLPTEGISVGQIDTNIFKVSEQCPVSQNLLVTLSSTSKSFGIEYDQLCDILRYMGYLISLVALLHAGQILVRDS